MKHKLKHSDFLKAVSFIEQYENQLNTELKELRKAKQTIADIEKERLLAGLPKVGQVIKITESRGKSTYFKVGTVWTVGRVCDNGDLLFKETRGYKPCSYKLYSFIIV